MYPPDSPLGSSRRIVKWGEGGFMLLAFVGTLKSCLFALLCSVCCYALPSCASAALLLFLKANWCSLAIITVAKTHLQKQLSPTPFFFLNRKQYRNVLKCTSLRLKHDFIILHTVQLCQLLLTEFGRSIPMEVLAL